MVVSAQATAANVGMLRRGLRAWLHRVLDDDPDSADDLVLAASEALENAADHAFVGAPTPGTMRIQGIDHGDRISVIISDDGDWQEPGPPGYRRRGLDLMNCLADASRVRPTNGGTWVTLVHHRLGRTPERRVSGA